jgi:tetratricopeptide (TPR) repeat protein
MADLEHLVQQLEAAEGDVHAQAATAAEFLLSAQPESHRERLSAGLDVAAMLRWFDVNLLARMLETSEEEARQLFHALDGLPFIEVYQAHDRELRNVHESTRLGWRKQMAGRRPSNFRTLSARATAFFADEDTARGRIEWLYHLLCADPDQGATELEKLDRDWSSRAHPEDRYALAVALEELEDTQLLHGRAHVWALLVIASTRVSRAESAQLMDAAKEALLQARTLADQRAEAEAQWLLGDVLEAQGKLAEAQSAYGEYLTISRRLAEQDPSNAGWQREVAVAHSRVGDVLAAQGKLAKAQSAYGEYLTISRRLAEQDPSNAGWQRGLEVAHSRVGDALAAQGKLAEAQSAYGEYLTISRRLAEQDPSNAGWQRDLAVAYSRVGDVLEAQGKIGEAQSAYGEYLTISRRLAEQDPSNAGWQRELAVAHSKVGDVLAAQGKMEEAQAAFGEYLTISRRLAGQDPSNAGWQRSLALACLEVARGELSSGRIVSSVSLYEKASRIFTYLWK